MRCVLKRDFPIGNGTMIKHVVTGASKRIGAAHGRGKHDSEVTS